MSKFAKTFKSLAKTLTVMMTVSVVLAFCFSTSMAAFDYTPLEVPVPVSCNVTGHPDEEVYEIVIEKLDKDAPSAKQELVTIKDSGSATFTVVVNEPGTYRYKVYEKAGSDSNIIYDDSVYQVTVFVTDDGNGKLQYQIILSNDDAVKPTAVNFVNSAKKPRAPIVATGEDSTSNTLSAVILLSSGTALLLAVMRKRREAENA